MLYGGGNLYLYDVVDATQDNQGPSGTTSKEGSDSVARIIMNTTNGNLTTTGNVTSAATISTTSTTDSTSTTSGSIHTDGGLGVAKDVIIGGDVCIGTTSPAAGRALHIKRTGSNAALTIEETSATNYAQFVELKDSTTSWYVANRYANTGALSSGFGIGTTSGGEMLQIDTNGAIIAPSQPAFLVYPNARITDVTGDGTAYTAVYNTEVFDQGGDFASNVFTAPIGGKYQFNVNVSLLGIVSGHTTCTITLVTSNRSIRTHFKANVYSQTGAGDQNNFNGSVLTDLDASDTAYVSILVDGGAKVVDFDGDGNYASAFSGYLVA